MKVFAGLGAALLLCLVLLAVAVKTAGPGSLVLSAAESDLPLCSEFAPVVVADLTTTAPPTCVPHGVPLLFPDGTSLDLSQQEPGSGGLTGGEIEYSYVNVGVFGMYAAHADLECEHLEEWGSAAAIHRVHETWGENYACPTR